MVDRVVDRGAGHGTTVLAWIAVIVAALALILAWVAFNRTGQDLEDRIQESVQEAVIGAEQGFSEDGSEDAIGEGQQEPAGSNTPGTTTPEGDTAPAPPEDDTNTQTPQ